MYPIKHINVWGLPLIMYTPRGRGGGLVTYTFPLHITCKKRGGGVQIVDKSLYVINGRPFFANIGQIRYYIKFYSEFTR